MALFFALGSTCFLVGPLPGYVQVVGGAADAITFFVGSILFNGRWRAPDVAGVGGMAVGRRRRTRGVVVRDRPIRRDAGISAVAGYVVPSTGSVIDLAAANWNTSLGAACFLACALDTLHTGRGAKMPLRRELRELEHTLERDLQRLT